MTQAQMASVSVSPLHPARLGSALLRASVVLALAALVYLGAAQPAFRADNPWHVVGLLFVTLWPVGALVFGLWRSGNPVTGYRSSLLREALFLVGVWLIWGSTTLAFPGVCLVCAALTCSIEDLIEHFHASRRHTAENDAVDAGVPVPAVDDPLAAVDLAGVTVFQPATAAGRRRWVELLVLLFVLLVSLTSLVVDLSGWFNVVVFCSWFLVGVPGAAVLLRQNDDDGVMTSTLTAVHLAIFCAAVVLLLGGVSNPVTYLTFVTVVLVLPATLVLLFVLQQSVRPFWLSGCVRAYYPGRGTPADAPGAADAHEPASALFGGMRLEQAAMTLPSAAARPADANIEEKLARGLVEAPDAPRRVGARLLRVLIVPLVAGLTLLQRVAGSQHANMLAMAVRNNPARYAVLLTLTTLLRYWAVLALLSTAVWRYRAL